MTAPVGGARKVKGVVAVINTPSRVLVSVRVTAPAVVFDGVFKTSSSKPFLRVRVRVISERHHALWVQIKVRVRARVRVMQRLRLVQSLRVFKKSKLRPALIPF